MSHLRTIRRQRHFTQVAVYVATGIDQSLLSKYERGYAIVNYEFARYLRSKYPNLKYLNRDEDMGIEGLRRAKLSYHPHRLVIKYIATYKG